VGAGWLCCAGASGTVLGEMARKLNQQIALNHLTPRLNSENRIRTPRKPASSPIELYEPLSTQVSGVTM
jgi:hypothetical protein